MLMPIGQFSRMVRLSIKALRLYAENGLLPPAQVDPESGYRYYHPSQARRAEIIRVLRTVDMPLEEIRELLEAAQSGAGLEGLTTHRRRMEERLRAQQRMLAYLGFLLGAEPAAVRRPISLESVPTRLVAGIRFHTRMQGIRNDVGKAFARIQQGIQRFQWRHTGPPMLVYHDVIDDQNDGELEACLPIQDAFEGKDGFDCHEIGGGPVASTIHRGPYEELPAAYHELFSWLMEQGHELSGPPREIYLNDPRVVSADKLDTRLEVPVRRGP